MTNFRFKVVRKHILLGVGGVRINETVAGSVQTRAHGPAYLWVPGLVFTEVQLPISTRLRAEIPSPETPQERWQRTLKSLQNNGVTVPAGVEALP